MKSRFIIFLFIGLFFLISSSLLTAKNAYSFTMSNDNFIIQMGNFNSFSGQATNSVSKIQYTSGETAPGLSSGQTNKVRAGFEYIHSTSAFIFTLSNGSIDFGTLSPTNPLTRTNTLSIISNTGYTVNALENHSLKLQAGNSIIPDTTCDDGLCSEVQAGSWENILTYGFGYRCDNIVSHDCSLDFIDQNSYKQFPKEDQEQQSEPIASSQSQANQSTIQITYKINISGTQPAGEYSNIITFIASPIF